MAVFHSLLRRQFARNYSTARRITFGSEARQLILAGCSKLTDAVSVTLGPKGRNVIIEQPYGNPKITKDGVTVAKAITFSDKMLNLGATLIKQVASSTNDRAGDGTTTATVLARAIYKDGCEAVAAGMNPMDLLKGISIAVDEVLKFLDKVSKKVTTAGDILSVATISANGDQKIGSLIATAIEKVGRDGTITINEGKAMHHELDIADGLRLDRGFISAHFISNNKTQKCELENPLIFLYEKKISHIKTIIPVLEVALETKRSLLIIAEDVDSEALATMILNKLRLGLNICAIKAPGFGDFRKSLYSDLEIITGAKTISEETGLRLEETKDLKTILGKAKSAIVGKDDTVIMTEVTSEIQSNILHRIEDLREQMQNSHSEYEKDRIRQRIGKFTNGVAVIKVGGTSEIDVSEARDRINDSLCATKAAIEEGVVPGGGTALLFASKELEQFSLKNKDIQAGVNIIKNACRIPCKLIAQNAGHEGSVVVGNILREGIFGKGFDAQNEKYVNMLDCGIIDPTKVVKSALRDASSVASLMTTTEAAICEVQEKSVSQRHSADSVPEGF